MQGAENKKMALLRILEILHQNSDADHPLTQEEIRHLLASNYGIVLERKAVGRNLSLLKEAGVDISSARTGCYLAGRLFEDAELRVLIDSVLSSKYITANHSKALIDKLCQQSSRHFRSHVKHIYSVQDWSKTENQALFLNVELMDEAITKGRQICYDYNKYGTDRKLHRSSTQQASPYQMILHNQRYYLMAYNEYWKHMTFHRLDRMTNVRILEESATCIRDIPGYEGGIDYSRFGSSMPYMYADEPESIEMRVEASIIDQVIDWFGTDIRIEQCEESGHVRVWVKAIPYAMEHWAMQYMEFVEILAPASLRSRIREILRAGAQKYRT